jgi:tetratricopeptide (TPR) repeat protein
MLQGSPLLRGLYALALTGLNRDAEALEQMKLARDEHGQILAQQPGARQGLESWLGTLQLVMADQDPGAYERLVMELAGGEPDPIELLAVARTWVRARGNEGVSHALELLSAAAAGCGADDEQLRAMIELDAGQYHVLIGDYQKAADAFVKVLESDPDHPLALNNAAYIYIEHLDDPARAIPFAERAAVVKPGDPFILDTLGWAHFGVESYVKAEEALRESIAAGPSADNYLHLAWVFYQTDRHDKAKDYLRYAAELKPNPDTQKQINDLTARLRR